MASQSESTDQMAVPANWTVQQKALAKLCRTTDEDVTAYLEQQTQGHQTDEQRLLQNREHTENIIQDAIDLMAPIPAVRRDTLFVSKIPRNADNSRRNFRSESDDGLETYYFNSTTVAAALEGQFPVQFNAVNVSDRPAVLQFLTSTVRSQIQKSLSRGDSCTRAEAVSLKSYSTIQRGFEFFAEMGISTEDQCATDLQESLLNMAMEANLYRLEYKEWTEGYLKLKGNKLGHSQKSINVLRIFLGVCFWDMSYSESGSIPSGNVLNEPLVKQLQQQLLSAILIWKQKGPTPIARITAAACFFTALPAALRRGEQGPIRTDGCEALVDPSTNEMWLGVDGFSKFLRLTLPETKGSGAFYVHIQRPNDAVIYLCILKWMWWKFGQENQENVDYLFPRIIHNKPDPCPMPVTSLQPGAANAMTQTQLRRVSAQQGQNQIQLTATQFSQGSIAGSIQTVGDDALCRHIDLLLRTKFGGKWINCFKQATGFGFHQPIAQPNDPSQQIAPETNATVHGPQQLVPQPLAPHSLAPQVPVLSSAGLQSAAMGRIVVGTSSVSYLHGLVDENGHRQGFAPIEEPFGLDYFEDPFDFLLASPAEAVATNHMPPIPSYLDLVYPDNIPNQRLFISAFPVQNVNYDRSLALDTTATLWQNIWAVFCFSIWLRTVAICLRALVCTTPLLPLIARRVSASSSSSLLQELHGVNCQSQLLLDHCCKSDELRAHTIACLAEPIHDLRSDPDEIHNLKIVLIIINKF
ncbi:hypothetical protein BDR26DRAFT_995095 [Obelidium mucronatum]|nr:hypothetical protein BDR26DRAFT_995095 [Obelidium mucronatum]